MQSTAMWRTAELTFESSRPYANPYLDVHVEALFSGPGGMEIRRPAYWDGDRTWRVRFAPTRPGAWRYRISSDQPSDAGLNGATGELECVEEQTDLAVYRRGFLRKGSGGRHLAHADGSPFFWLGDTHWRFAWESWDKANKLGWTSQFRGMVDRRTEQGFTIYQSNMMSFAAKGAASSCWLPGKEYWVVDVEYFRTVFDPRMAYIADRGLVNALGLGWYPAVDDDPAGLARFARYIVARYGSYPMVWTLGGEVAGYDPARRQQRIDGWREVALAIRDIDGYDHPWTAHLTAEHPIPDHYQGEDWLTLTLNQHGHGDFDLHTTDYHTHLAAYPGTPLVEGESLYEGLISVEYAGRRPVTDTMVRQAAYRAIQSGCCGYTYGAQGCWNAAWDRDHGNSMWGDLPWYEGIDLPGAVQLGHLRRFWESLDWTALRPDADVFVSENALNNTLYRPDVTADEHRGTVVIFFGETYRIGDGGAALTNVQDRPYRLRWFDPRTGEFRTPDRTARPSAGHLALPDKPDGSDWLLVAQVVEWLWPSHIRGARKR